MDEAIKYVTRVVAGGETQFLVPPTAGTPANGYVAEDGTTNYVAEDNVTFYVQET